MLHDIIRNSRLAQMVSVDEMVALTGINKPSYYDLEAYPDECIYVIDLLELFIIFHHLQINPFYALPDAVQAERKPESFSTIRNELLIASDGGNPDKIRILEELLNYDIAELLKNERGWLHRNLESLMVFSAHFNLDYVSVFANEFEYWKNECWQTKSG